jgi:phospholipase/carboxylesterase
MRASRHHFGQQALLAVATAILSACGARVNAPTIEALEWVELRTGGAEASDTLPLIIALHGRGDHPEGFARTFEGFETPARIALIRAPIPEGEHFAWFTFRRTQTWRHVAEDLDVVSDRVARTAELIASERATRGRPMAVGFSQGGNLIYTLALRHPARFSALFPVSSGFVQEALAWEQFDVPQTPPIVAFHGTSDEVIPIGVERDSIRMLQGLGIRAELHEHEAPHWIVPTMRSDLHRALGEAISRIDLQP